MKRVQEQWLTQKYFTKSIKRHTDNCCNALEKIARRQKLNSDLAEVYCIQY